ncbi:MAG: pirin family protein [Chlorobi bacterium]|nr:MAG: pirin family protein [Chlorobi bacterium OLB7]MBK8911334.1 pirin family protein [Chlorobiota bacterium]
MNTNRTVAAVAPARTFDMGGIPIRQPLPSQELEYLDPFILLHHGVMDVSPNMDLRHAGVGPHPHRGFAPVTFLFEGGLRHRDSRGNDSTVHAGGTQWMNAGMGVIHSERPVEHFNELIQLWVNIPAAHKMDQPSYYPLTKADTPSATNDDGTVRFNVIAGEMLGLTGPIPTLSPVNAVTIQAEEGGSIFFPIPESHNAFLYLLSGSIQIEGFGRVIEKNLVAFNNNGSGIAFTSLEPTRALLMTGEPLNEEIVTHGPFVMNDQTQILEAFRDYKMGRMGVLVE